MDVASDNILEARERALLYARTALTTAYINYPSNNDTYSDDMLMPTLDQIKVYVDFVDRKTCLEIFSEDIHGMILRLEQEAAYFVNNGLILTDQLKEIYQNTDTNSKRNDPIAPAFKLHKGKSGCPNSYRIVKILPYHTDLLLDNPILLN